MSPDTLKHVHGWLTVTWALMMPLAIITGWIYLVAFISVISIYANFASHFSAWQGARAEKEANNHS